MTWYILWYSSIWRFSLPSLKPSLKNPRPHGQLICFKAHTSALPPRMGWWVATRSLRSVVCQCSRHRGWPLRMKIATLMQFIMSNIILQDASYVLDKLRLKRTKIPLLCTERQQQSIRNQQWIMFNSLEVTASCNDINRNGCVEWRWCCCRLGFAALSNNHNASTN